MPRTTSISCRLALTLMVGGLFSTAVPCVGAEPVDPTIEFNRDVRPILSDLVGNTDSVLDAAVKRLVR